MLKGFISYAHENDNLCEMFRKQLNLLELSDVVSFWSDHGVEPGDPWKSVIIEKLNQARVALFLISPDLFWSPFVRDVEWPLARQRMRQDELLVIPVVLCETVLWERVFDGEVGQLQAVPRHAKPIELRRPRSAGCAEAARMIADMIERRWPRA
jgi:hypothetical protein